MEILVRNAEGFVSSRDRDYATQKLGRLGRYCPTAQRVELVHRKDRGLHRLQITIFAGGQTVRGEEQDASLTAAIDKVFDKLHAQLTKLKGKLTSGHRRQPSLGHASVEAPREEPTPTKMLKERKTFLVKPMSAQEAAMQMDLMDVPFFVYKDEDSSQMSVLYKRKDGHYGLLEPEM